MRSGDVQKDWLALCANGDVPALHRRNGAEPCALKHQVGCVLCPGVGCRHSFARSEFGAVGVVKAPTHADERGLLSMMGVTPGVVDTAQMLTGEALGRLLSGERLDGFDGQGGERERSADADTKALEEAAAIHASTRPSRMSR